MNDLIAGGGLDLRRRFLPDGLALMDAFDMLAPEERRFVSQIQGRTYAGMHALLARFAGEELGREAPFGRLEAMMAAGMPAGYRFVPDPAVVAAVVRSRSAWSVLALACLVRLFTQAHGRQGMAQDGQLDPAWREAFLFHWKEASRRARLDELEWRREDARLDDAARERAVGDLIVLIGVLDGILQAQAEADARYFAAACGRAAAPRERAAVAGALLAAYRWQYILSGVQIPHFGALLAGMVSASQHGRLAAALAPLFDRASLPAVRPA